MRLRSYFRKDVYVTVDVRGGEPVFCRCSAVFDFYVLLQAWSFVTRKCVHLGSSSKIEVIHLPLYNQQDFIYRLYRINCVTSKRDLS